MRAAIQPAEFLFALSRLEAEPLPEADYPTPRSLEALRLEDPAADVRVLKPWVRARAHNGRVAEGAERLRAPVCVCAQTCPSRGFLRHADIQLTG